MGITGEWFILRRQNFIFSTVCDNSSITVNIDILDILDLHYTKSLIVLIVWNHTHYTHTDLLSNTNLNFSKCSHCNEPHAAFCKGKCKCIFSKQIIQNKNIILNQLFMLLHCWISTIICYKINKYVDFIHFC